MRNLIDWKLYWQYFIQPNYILYLKAKDSAGNVAGRIELQGQGFLRRWKKTKIIEESSKPGETLYILQIGNQELNSIWNNLIRINILCSSTFKK